MGVGPSRSFGSKDLRQIPENPGKAVPPMALTLEALAGEKGDLTLRILDVVEASSAGYEIVLLGSKNRLGASFRLAYTSTRADQS